MGAVANEHHVLLVCTATLGVWQRYDNTLRWPRTVSLPALFQANTSTADLLKFVHVALRHYASAAGAVLFNNLFLIESAAIFYC